MNKQSMAQQSLKQPAGLNKTESAVWLEAARLFSDPSETRDQRDRAWGAYLDAKRARDQRIGDLSQWLSRHRIDEELPTALRADLDLLRESPEVRRLAAINTLCSWNAPVDERRGRTRLACLLCESEEAGAAMGVRDDVFLKSGEWIEQRIERGEMTKTLTDTIEAMPPDMQKHFFVMRSSVESRLAAAAAGLGLVLRLDPGRPHRGLRHFVYLLLATLPATS